MALWARGGGNVGVLGVPGGVNGNVQYNNNGQFGGYTDVQLTTHIQLFTTTLSGAVPASGSGVSTKFIAADGVWRPIIPLIETIAYWGM